MPLTAIVTESGNLNAEALMAKLVRRKVLVGIPEGAQPRKNTDGSEQITNAQLLYIHTNGSPRKNIPARPVIQPAIEAKDNWERITDMMRQAARAELDGDEAKATELLTKTGLFGQNAARRWFTDPRNGWQQNAPSTIRAKLEKLRGKKKAQALAILDSVASYRPETGTSALDEINTPLVDTAQLRRSIVYAVVED